MVDSGVAAEETQEKNETTAEGVIEVNELNEKLNTSIKSSNISSTIQWSSGHTPNRKRKVIRIHAKWYSVKGKLITSRDCTLKTNNRWILMRSTAQSLMMYGKWSCQCTILKLRLKNWMPRIFMKKCKDELVWPFRIHHPTIFHKYSRKNVRMR